MRLSNEEMRTKDIRINNEYSYDGENIIVIERIKGQETVKRNMQSGMLFTGMHRQRKKFLLSNGEIVYSDKLQKIQS